MTRQALMAYSLGLLGLIMVKVLAPGFYARQNIRTPVKVAIFTLIATQLMNLAFIVPFKHAGLALAIGLGACLNAGLLYALLRRHGIYTPQPGWLLFMLKIFTAVLLMCAALYWAHGSDASWLHPGFLPRAVKLGWMVLMGAGVYFMALLLMGIRPVQFYRRAA
jgi:putative peptidoglycan lipid II flippase